MLLLALGLVGDAQAHGSRFGLSALSIAPDDPDMWWANANGWGIVYTADAGESWTWRCEEGIGTRNVYDLVALGGSRALLATAEGLLVIGGDLDPAGDSCTSNVVPGLPEGAFVTDIAESDAGFYAAVYADGSGALYRCDPELSGCAPTGLQGLYVKSVVVGSDPEVVYAITADPVTLAERLWMSTEPDAFTAVSDWPDGDVDLRILAVNADRLWLWRIPRSDAGVPTLLYSGDAGSSFSEVFSDGLYTDPVPGFALAGDDAWLGSDVGRTWRSIDGGRQFFDVSEDEPAVRCSAYSDGILLVCADHFGDGFDVGRWGGGQRWSGAGCLDSAVTDACEAETCDLYHDAFVAAGEFGGGECHSRPVEPGAPCGCGGSAGLAVVATLPLTAAWSRRRRRQRRAGLNCRRVPRA